MWETLYRCLPKIRTTMRTSRINEIENGLTLHQFIHYVFGRFECAFEPIIRHRTLEIGCSFRKIIVVWIDTEYQFIEMKTGPAMRRM